MSDLNSNVDEVFKKACERLEILRGKLHRYEKITDFEWKSISKDFKRLSNSDEFRHKSFTALGTISAMRVMKDEYFQYMDLAASCGSSYFYQLNNVLSGFYIGEFERVLLYRDIYKQYSGFEQLLSAITGAAQAGVYYTAGDLIKRFFDLGYIPAEEGDAFKRRKISVGSFVLIEDCANYLMQHNIPEERVCERIGDAARIITRITGKPIISAANMLTESGIIYDFIVDDSLDKLLELDWAISTSAAEKFDDDICEYFSVGVSPLKSKGEK